MMVKFKGQVSRDNNHFDVVSGDVAKVIRRDLSYSSPVLLLSLFDHDNPNNYFHVMENSVTYLTIEEEIEYILSQL